MNDESESGVQDIEPDWLISEPARDPTTCAWCGARTDAGNVFEFQGAGGGIDETVLCSECWPIHGST